MGLKKLFTPSVIEEPFEGALTDDTLDKILLIVVSLNPKLDKSALSEGLPTGKLAISPLSVGLVVGKWDEGALDEGGLDDELLDNALAGVFAAERDTGETITKTSLELVMGA